MLTRTDRWLIGIPAALAIVLGFGGAMMVGVHVLLRSVEGAPYRMTVRSAGGKTTVQFARIDRGLVSPVFPVNPPLTTSGVFDLRNDQMPIPGCKVEFHDPTILPGDFRVRVGGSRYDLVPGWIEVDGKSVDWQRAGSTPKPTDGGTR